MQKWMRAPVGATVIAATIAMAAGTALGGPYDPPAGYYDTATGTGTTLKSNLHVIISRDWWTPGSSTHNFQDYANAPKALAIMHRRVSEDIGDDKQILMYNAEVETQIWMSGAGWNREHTWPRSRGVGTTGHDNSDLHMLRPTDSSVNGSRGNLPFGTGGGEWDPNALGGVDRGEIARCMFYAETRYDGGDPDTNNLLLVVGSPGGNQMGDLGELLAWHYDEAPDDRERFRNHLLWSNDPYDWEDDQVNPPITIPGFERDPIPYHQGNRNPFIDHPEFVWAIWGLQVHGANNSTLHVGGAPAGDGSSSDTIDLGSIIAGGTVTGLGVQVTKLGSHPTTYDVTGTGAASGTLLQGQTVPFNPQTFDITGVELAAPTAGAVSGTLVIDNTDLTSSGPGTGSADGDDIVTIDATALDPSNASFTLAGDFNSFVWDFGQVPMLSGAAPLDLNVVNLEATPGLTADLDIDAIQGSGDTGAFDVDLVPQSGVAAGASVAFQAIVDASVPEGAYQAVYTIQTSDEDIPGATAGAPLTLTVSVEVTAPSPCDGDTNGDGVTDVFDFNTVTQNFGTAAGATRQTGDLTNDGAVNVFDFNIVTQDFGCGT